MFGILSDADTGSYDQIVAGLPIRYGVLGQQSLPRLLRMHRISQTGEHNHELIAAQTSDLSLHAVNADLVDHALQSLRDLAQQRIAGSMTQGVIDTLELIQIDVQQRHVPMAPPRLREHLR